MSPPYWETKRRGSVPGDSVAQAIGDPACNLVPRAFPLKNGWGNPFFKGKALKTRLSGMITNRVVCPRKLKGGCKVNWLKRLEFEPTQAMNNRDLTIRQRRRS